MHNPAPILTAIKDPTTRQEALNKLFFVQPGPMEAPLYMQFMFSEKISPAQLQEALSYLSVGERERLLLAYHYYLAINSEYIPSILNALSQAEKDRLIYLNRSPLIGSYCDLAFFDLFLFILSALSKEYRHNALTRLYLGNESILVGTYRKYIESNPKNTAYLLLFEKSLELIHPDDRVNVFLEENNRYSANPRILQDAEQLFRKGHPQLLNIILSKLSYDELCDFQSRLAKIPNGGNALKNVLEQTYIKIAQLGTPKEIPANAYIPLEKRPFLARPVEEIKNELVQMLLQDHLQTQKEAQENYDVERIQTAIAHMKEAGARAVMKYSEYINTGKENRGVKLGWLSYPRHRLLRQGHNEAQTFEKELAQCQTLHQTVKKTLDFFFRRNNKFGMSNHSFGRYLIDELRPLIEKEPLLKSLFGTNFPDYSAPHPGNVARMER